VSGVGESTRIACQTSPGTTLDVVTVDQTGVGVTGDLAVSEALECNSLTVLNSVSAADLSLTGDLTVGGRFLGQAVSPILETSTAQILGATSSTLENFLIVDDQATADGLLVGTIHTDAQNTVASIWGETRTNACPTAVVVGSSEDLKAGAAITAVSGQDHFTRVNSFLLPVRKGEYYCVWYYQEAVTNQSNYVFLRAYWWPLGSP
jgi:hypothetical protein